MSRYIVTEEQMTGIANAIRGRSGKSGTLTFPDGFINTIQGMKLIAKKMFNNVWYPEQKITLQGKQSLTVYAEDSIKAGSVVDSSLSTVTYSRYNTVNMPQSASISVTRIPTYSNGKIRFKIVITNSGNTAITIYTNAYIYVYYEAYAFST